MQKEGLKVARAVAKASNKTDVERSVRLGVVLVCKTNNDRPSSVVVLFVCTVCYVCWISRRMVRSERVLCFPALSGGWTINLFKSLPGQHISAVSAPPPWTKSHHILNNRLFTYTIITIRSIFKKLKDGF